jgi:hypothetical protein
VHVPPVDVKNNGRIVLLTPRHPLAIFLLT